MISINHIQQAHKKADNGFNDVIAELYDLEFRKQEILKQDHVKDAKEKAVEQERIEQAKILQQRRIEEEKARIDKEKQEQADRERTQAIEQANNSKREQEQPASDTQNTGFGSTWDSVSPEAAAQYMASKTGVSASTWQQIIYRESTNNPTVTNSIGCFGYLQLHPVHGNVSSMTPQQYLDTAVGVYNSQGLSAWEVVTNGMVQ